MSNQSTLLALRQTLLADLDQATDAAATVDLDQNKVGRLSRMDAMQQQAMQKASLVALRLRLANVDKALQVVADGGYGYCDSCGHAISPQRLAVVPESLVCVACLTQQAL